MCTFYFNMSDFPTHSLPLGFLWFVIKYCKPPSLRASELSSTASVAWGRSPLQNIPTNVIRNFYLLLLLYISVESLRNVFEIVNSLSFSCYRS